MGPAACLAGMQRFSGNATRAKTRPSQAHWDKVFTLTLTSKSFLKKKTLKASYIKKKLDKFYHIKTKNLGM